MIVLCVTNCPPGLRGDLSKWLNEINAGVYVGRLSARVREELWDRVCIHIKNGQATMVYSTTNEQGYAFLAHNTTWIPVDFEGITLMQKPLIQMEPEEQDNLLPQGFSKASKFEKLSHLKSSKESSGYVVVDVETTGRDFDKDRIMEVALLKIRESEIVERFQCFIKSGVGFPADAERLTDITDDTIEKQGIGEEDALKKISEFIGNDLIVGYDVQFHVNFIQKLAKRVGKDITIKKTRDILRMVRRELDDLENYKLETVAEYFSLNTGNVHRALINCILAHRIYCKLNEL